MNQIWAAPGFSFLFFLVLHCAIWQIRSIRYRGVFLMSGVSVLALAFVIGLGWEWGESFAGFVAYTSSVHFFLFLFYMHLYVGIDRSVSIRILGEVMKTGENGLSRSQLGVTYPQEAMFQHRLELLVEKGWLSLDQGKFICTPKAERLGRLAIFLRKLYALDVTG